MTATLIQPADAISQGIVVTYAHKKDYEAMAALDARFVEKNGLSRPAMTANDIKDDASKDIYTVLYVIYQDGAVAGYSICKRLKNGEISTMDPENNAVWVKQLVIDPECPNPDAIREAFINHVMTARPEGVKWEGRYGAVMFDEKSHPGEEATQRALREAAESHGLRFVSRKYDAAEFLPHTAMIDDVVISAEKIPDLSARVGRHGTTYWNMTVVNREDTTQLVGLTLPDGVSIDDLIESTMRNIRNKGASPINVQTVAVGLREHANSRLLG